MKVKDIEFQFQQQKRRIIIIIISQLSQVLRDYAVSEGLNTLKSYYIQSLLNLRCIF